MPPAKLQFLWFEGCPLAERQRMALDEAIARLDDAEIQLETIDIHAEGAPEALRRWGSPTILVDGEDITGAEAGSGSACRLYPYQGGVIPAEVLVEWLAEEAGD